MTKPLCELAQKELEKLIGILNLELTDINATRRRKAATLSEVQAELTRRKEDARFRPSISDHAILRYLERIGGVDVEGLRTKLLTPELQSAMRSQANKYTCDGITYMLRDNTVVTIVDRGA